MGNHHSSTQVATEATRTITATATPSPAAVTSVLSSRPSSIIVPSTLISPTSIISNSQSSLLSTQVPPSPNISPAVTVSVTLTPSTVTISTTESPKALISSVTITATPAVSTIVEQPSGALVALAAGRLENAPTSASSSLLLTMASATASPVTSGLSTAGIVMPGKKAVGPFAPEGAILGGIPTSGLDVPLTVVFLILFLGGAATHFSIHEYNGKRGHKFHLSDAVFDFCMVRTVTCTMRIVWAFRPNNISVVLAALIFENAGVVVLFAVNVIFTQRMIRALNPKIGWNPIFGNFVNVILISVPMIIVWNIVNLVVSFYTLNPHSIEVTKDLLLFGSCWTLFLSLFPLLFIGFLGFSDPYGGKIENFGLGSFNAKLIILLSATSMLVIGAIVRLVAAVQPHPKNAPGAIDSKLVFYITGFFLEIVVVYLYAASRIDLRFWVPNGSSQPGDYSKAKSGFTLPSEEEEALFQEVDFKMRFSSGTNLPRDEKPEGQWSDDGTIASPRWRASTQRWQDLAVDRTKATREQVRQAIFDLKLNSELVGQPVSVGNEEELLVYAFRCRKGSFSDDGERRGSGGLRMPRKIVPPRSESWAAKDRSVTPESMRDVI